MPHKYCDTTPDSAALTLAANNTDMSAAEKWPGTVSLGHCSDVWSTIDLAFKACYSMPCCVCTSTLQAGIFQVVFILGSGLLLFVSRTPCDDSGTYGGYGAF
jgi:hypothetical protein